MRFRVLGPLRVEDGQGPGPAKHRALLAALLLSAGRAVPVERLVSVLWGDQPPQSADPVLRVYVSALRKIVDGITTVPGGYLIAADPDEVDCHRFERLVGQARMARDAGAVAEAAGTFREALGLWRGQALADVDSAELRRAHGVPLEELRLTAVEERVELDLRLGRGAEVVGELRALVNAHPLRERAWAHLLAALHQAGRRSEALAAYQEARRILVDDLGLEPGAELREAHERVLRGEVAAVPVAERRVPLNETPPDISDFTGRADVLAWILRAATPEGGGGAPVLLVVHGPPGSGKSAVAVRAASRMDLPDGRLYAVLGGRAPGAVLEDLLRSLGCPDGSVPPTLGERVRLYRRLTSGRRLLLVLDDAADETQVRPLLPTGAGSVTLVTSRSPLAGLEAARAYELGVLAPDEALDMLAGVAGRDRVAAEPEAAREIVRLCGGLPLALRIAGSRLARKTGWTVAHLAGRLGDERRRLDELSAGDLAVRGSLAVGYRGLAEPERRLLRELGAWTGPDFADWALGADLEPLAEAGLLQSLGLDEAGQERYGWHDLTRLYAVERLAEAGGPGPVLRARAAEVLDRARRARSALLPAEPGSGRTLVSTPDDPPTPRPTPARGDQASRGPVAAPYGVFPLSGETSRGTAWLRREARWLAAERRFLAAAVGDFHRAGLHEAAWRLAFYLTPLFELGGHHDDWHATTATGLDAARAAGHRQGEALLLRGLADLHRVEGRADAAAAALRAAQPLVEGLELARVTLRLGLVEPRRPEAERVLRRALTVFEQAGDLRGRADALRGLGALLDDQAMLERSLAGYEELGDPRGAAEARLDLARLHLRAGRYAEAREHAELRIAANRRLGDRLPEAAGLLVLAAVARAAGVPESAAEPARQAAETYTAYGDRRNAAAALLLLARTYLELGRNDGAVDALMRAMGEFDVLGDRQGRAEAEHLAREARRRL
ncbi:AfsR/SARP family transcriptional regulator [Nonomuraea ceibae]|uniref:AfsR/SARP family transcriptional regulator n=1 Tax=Nonomuraea ceibae TaxID=1935170 RepID=UPI001C600DD8|nr:BTAD domain-containing putative transcriptional regulator [Nonomuraea ceibae]